jgi:hypothetical protein
MKVGLPSVFDVKNIKDIMHEITLVKRIESFSVILFNDQVIFPIWCMGQE